MKQRKASDTQRLYQLRQLVGVQDYQKMSQRMKPLSDTNKAFLRSHLPLDRLPVQSR